MRAVQRRCLPVAVVLVAVFGLAAATIARAGARAGLDGEWTLSFDTPQGVMEASASFKVEGDTFSGTMDGAAGSTPLTGTLKGDTFACTFEVQTGQGPISVAMEGTVDGDGMKGTFNYGQGTGDFTGKRKAQ